MEWKKFKEEKPKVGEYVYFLKIVRTNLRKKKKEIGYECITGIGKMQRPFENDRKYNPDYYCFCFDNVMYEILDEDFWRPITLPAEITTIDRLVVCQSQNYPREIITVIPRLGLGL